MSSLQNENANNGKKAKPKRAEREIYRPGALRQLKTQTGQVVFDSINNGRSKSKTGSNQSADIQKNKVIDKEVVSLSRAISEMKIVPVKEICKSSTSDEKKLESELKNGSSSKPEKNKPITVISNNFKNKSSSQQENHYKDNAFKQKRNDHYKSNYKEYHNSFIENYKYNDDRDSKPQRPVGKQFRDDSYSDESFHSARTRPNTGLNKELRMKKSNTYKEEKLNCKILNKDDKSNCATKSLKTDEYKCPNENIYKDGYQEGSKKSRFKNMKNDSSSYYKSEYKTSRNNGYEYYTAKQVYDKNKRNRKFMVNNDSRPRHFKNKEKEDRYVKQEKIACKPDKSNVANFEYHSSKTTSFDEYEDCDKKNTKYPKKSGHFPDKKEKSRIVNRTENLKSEEHNVDDKQNHCHDDIKDLRKPKVSTLNKNIEQYPSDDNSIKGTDEEVDLKLPKFKTKLHQETSKINEISDVIPSSEESVSDEGSVTSEKSRKSVNPMQYIDFKENSFYENPPCNKTVIRISQAKGSQSASTSWSDEKWSPPQRQRKKNRKNKDAEHAESPGRRGIIQINNTPSLESNVETVTPGQRLLFNPNNPSKPLAVIPSARDLPPSWDNTYAVQEKQDDTHNVPGTNSLEPGYENEGVGALDPSIFYSIQKGELDINYFVNSNQLPQEFKRIMDIRLHLQRCYKQLLISDIRLCQEKNVESALWKSLYYIIIEKLREYISREPTLKDRSLSTLMMIVEEGLNYFQSLLADIQKAYRFSLDAHFEEDLTTLPGTKNRVRHALYSCQKIILSMGDLARYREQYNPNPNYSQAKKWYEMALQVNPKNGRPFNQLAIIAVSQKRSLDVVYYYIRSLTASNPFTSARDSLISMFDDIRRKYESMNLKKPALDNSSRFDDYKYNEQKERRRDGSLRQEIWIRPDSGATNKRTLSQSDPEEEKKACIDELMLMPHDQLMKQFLTSYLHCHGMLFSRVGLDHFNKVLGETLNRFQALLQISPPKLSGTHLLQIMAINMFAIDNTQLRDSRIESSYRSAAQDLALLLSQEMFSRLAEVIVKLFPSCLNYTVKESLESTAGSSPSSSASSTVKEEKPGTTNPGVNLDNQRLFLPPLTNFIPAAKIWCDWLLYQSSVWNPPPVSHDISGMDTWGVIGELATIVKGIVPPDIVLKEDTPSPTPAYFMPVTLPEDAFLKGYVHVVSAQVGSHYASSGSNKERAQDWIRVRKLQVCLSQFLCGVEPPVLRLQKTDQGEILVAVVTVTPPDSPAVARCSGGSSEIDLEVSSSDIEGSNSDEEDLASSLPETIGEDTPLASTCRLLAKRKKLLEKKQRQQRKHEALIEGAVTLEMEVKPRYLVPDTNCFIEKLCIIKALIDSARYTFMVPLIVLVELDGLSKDAAVEKYGDVTHAVNVREGAATALHFIQSNKNPHLKCVTSQGSVAPANMFSLEMDTLKDITNDDKILSCCLHLCSDANKRRPIKEGVRRLHREVVLLTEDRNLRVKAYARDVPVRELTDFAHWAGIK